MRAYLLPLLMVLVPVRNASASTVLVDFDQLPASLDSASLRSLAGQTWTNFGVIAASYALGPKGLIEGVVSTPNVAFNFDPSLPSTIAGRSFGLLDAWFSAWQDNPLQVTVLGQDAENDTIFSSTFEVDTLGPKLETFGWQGLASVAIAATGAFTSGRFSIDDVRLGVAIPEPRLMVILGFGVCSIGMRGTLARRLVR